MTILQIPGMTSHVLLELGEARCVVRRDQVSFCFFKSLKSLLKTTKGRRAFKKGKYTTNRNDEVNKDGIFFGCCAWLREKRMKKQTSNSGRPSQAHVRHSSGQMEQPSLCCQHLWAAGSSWCRGAASSHACQLATIASLSVHGSNAHMDIMGAMWWEAENKKRKRSDAERGQRPSWERRQVEPVATSRVTIEHEIPLYLSLSPSNPFILATSFFFLYKYKHQPPAKRNVCLEVGHGWLTAPIMHLEGVTLCQIIMRLLGEGQWGGFVEERMDGKGAWRGMKKDRDGRERGTQWENRENYVDLNGKWWIHN